MILIDTSAWVEFFNGGDPETCRKVDTALAEEIVVMGDLVYCEVLQGLYNPRQRREVRELFLALPQFELVGYANAEKASAHYRQLREGGVTIRKTIDVLIGTFCADHEITLIHHDRDFERMKAVVRLQTY